jgi:hypothetical protein
MEKWPVSISRWDVPTCDWLWSSLLVKIQLYCDPGSVDKNIIYHIKSYNIILNHIKSS